VLCFFLYPLNLCSSAPLGYAFLFPFLCVLGVMVVQFCICAAAAAHSRIPAAYVSTRRRASSFPLSFVAQESPMGGAPRPSRRAIRRQCRQLRHPTPMTRIGLDTPPQTHVSGLSPSLHTQSHRNAPRHRGDCSKALSPVGRCSSR